MKQLKQCGLALLLAGLSLPVFAATINVNEASKSELMNGIDGLTEQQAQAIVDYRNEEGAIVTLHELYILGVDKNVISNNYAKLTVGDATWGDKKDS